MDEDTGLDSGPNALHLTNFGGVTNLSGIVSNSIHFPNSASKYYQVADSDLFSAIGSNSLTISYWVKPFATNAFQVAVGKGTTSNGGKEYSVGWSSTANAWFFEVFTNAATSIAAFAPTNFIVANQWYFLAAKIDTTNQTASIRYGTTNSLGPWSTYQMTAFGPANRGTNTTAVLRIGNPQANVPVNGLIDSAVMHRRALSDMEVTNLWNSGGGKQWPFD
jgi:hypothetical protein